MTVGKTASYLFNKRQVILNLEAYMANSGEPYERVRMINFDSNSYVEFQKGWAYVIYRGTFDEGNGNYTLKVSFVNWKHDNPRKGKIIFTFSDGESDYLGERNPLLEPRPYSEIPEFEVLDGSVWDAVYTGDMRVRVSQKATLTIYSQEKDRLIRTLSAFPGDVVILSKGEYLTYYDERSEREVVALYNWDEGFYLNFWKGKF